MQNNSTKAVLSLEAKHVHDICNKEFTSGGEPSGSSKDKLPKIMLSVKQIL